MSTPTTTRIVITADDKTRAGFASAKRGMHSLGAEAAALGKRLSIAGAAGAASAAAGLVAMVNSQRQVFDELAKLSQKTGLAVEDLSRLQFAAELSGVSNDQLATSFRTLSQRIADAAKGTGEAAEAFRAMGVDVKGTDGSLRNQNDVLRDVADRFASYKDGAEKSALAQRLFGKVGAELIPLLNQGADGLQSMADESDRLGRTISAETARAAEQFNDNITRLSASLEGLSNLIAGPVIRSLADMSTEMLRAAQDGETIMGVFERVLRGGVVGNRSDLVGAARDIETLTEQYNRLKREIAPYDASGQSAPDYLQARLGRVSAELKLAQSNYQKFVDDLNKSARTAASLTAPVVGGTVAPRGAAAGRVINAQERIYEAVQRQIAALEMQAATFGVAERQATLYKLSIEGATDAQIASADVLLRELNVLRQRADEQNRLNALLDATPTAQLESLRGEMLLLQKAFLATDITAEQFVEAAQTRLGTLPENVKQAADQMTVFADQAARNMQTAFADFLFDPFEDGVEGMVLGFVDSIRRMASELLASQLLNLLGTSLSGQGGFLGTLGTALSGIKPRAAGGPVSGGSTYLVGERGPELFVPRNSGSIVPNNKLQSAQPSQNNIRIVNTIDPAFVGDYIASPSGEQVILNVIRRNPGVMRSVVA
ncbi:phage tail tape measure protein [Rhodocyclaceae bacterium SMB388]